MPQIMHYTVTQTRSVEVVANNLQDAVRIATAAFEAGQNSDKGVRRNNDVEAELKGVWGNTTSFIKITGVNASLAR